MSKNRSISERARNLPLHEFVSVRFTEMAIPRFDVRSRKIIAKAVTQFCEELGLDFSTVTVGEFLNNPLYLQHRVLRMPGCGKHSYKAFRCLLERFDLGTPPSGEAHLSSEAQQLLKDTDG